MRATDQMLARVASEIEEKQQFIDGLVEDAQKDGRDLNEQEMELATRARKRVSELQPQVDQLVDLRRQLRSAVEREAYEEAARLRDLLRQKEATDESG